MMTSPLFLVREFAGLDDTSYRVAGRRARNYWEFLEHVHGIFNKPWEQYNAHFHLDNETCAGRVSPSEWEAGGYFEAEFMVEGRLTLYAHFAKVETRTRQVKAKPQEKNEAWRWGWHGSEDIGNKWYKSEETDDVDFDAWDKDPYPPFPETLPTNTIVDIPLVNRCAIIPSVIMDGFCTPSSTHTSSQSSLTAPSMLEIVTVNDTNSSHHLDNGIIVGRAKSHCCRDANVRPVVRAVLNGKGSVCVYIPSKYAKRSVSTGDVQISMKDVEFSKEFGTASSDEKRLMAIRHQLQAKHAKKRQPEENSILDLLPSGSVVKKRKHRRAQSIPAGEEGPIIGRALPKACRFPKEPAIVRATVNKVGAVLAYIPAKDSLKPYASAGRAQFPMSSVVFTEELAALKWPMRTKVIKERVLAAMDKDKAGVAQQQDEEEERLVDAESA